jgi:hypothetical protein
MEIVSPSSSVLAVIPDIGKVKQINKLLIRYLDAWKS